jgi:hypothetical protein
MRRAMRLNLSLSPRRNLFEGGLAKIEMCKALFELQSCREFTGPNLQQHHFFWVLWLTLSHREGIKSMS